MGKSIRSNLSYLRFARGKLTQGIVAEATGLGQKTLSALETGKSKGIEFSTLLKLCDYFECAPGDLLLIEEDPLSDKSVQKARRLVARGLKVAIKASRQSPERVWEEFDSVRERMQQAAEDIARTKYPTKGKKPRKRAKGHS